MFSIAKKTLVDSLSNFNNFFMNGINCHDKHMTALLNRYINSNCAIYKFWEQGHRPVLQFNIFSLNKPN